MKLFIIIDETSFYHPKFLERFISETNDDVVGIGIVKKIPKKHSLSIYLRNHFYYLKPNEILKLIFHKIIINKGNVFSSVKKVCEYYNINYFNINHTLNKDKYIKCIELTKPDIIISSNSLYFDKIILDIPKICCINRHSSLLPSYKGLWPVFYAFLNGEKEVGVTIHIMGTKYDEGKILSQKVIKIKNGDTIADLYEKCFDESVECLLNAIRVIKNSSIGNSINKYLDSYYSFPKKKHWNEFRKRGGVFI